MVVLLVLYLLVFLLNEWLQKPILVGMFGLPYWAFLFVNNAVSVVLLSLILPPVSRRLSWWLRPVDHDGKRDIAGALLVVAFYSLWLIVDTRRGSEVRSEGRRGYLRTRRWQNPASRGWLTQQGSTTVKLY